MKNFRQRAPSPRPSPPGEGEDSHDLGMRRQSFQPAINDSNGFCKAKHEKIRTATKSKFILFFLLFVALCLDAGAQSFKVDWERVAGGGATSSNGQFAVSGTIGQHDAGPSMSAGDFSLVGGFWALYAVPMPGAPMLSITPSGTSATVSWLVSSRVFVLQTNVALTTNGWSNFNGVVSTNAGVASVSIASRPGRLFFRLHGQ